MVYSSFIKFKLYMDLKYLSLEISINTNPFTGENGKKAVFSESSITHMYAHNKSIKFVESI